MFVTLTLAALSARSEKLKPEVLYVGTVFIDLSICEVAYALV